MKLDIVRSYTAPFTTVGETSLLSIHFIAAMVSIAIFAIQLIASGVIEIMDFLSEKFVDGGVGSALMIAMTIIVAILFLVLMFLSYALPAGYILETVKLEVYNRASVMPSWSGNIKRFFINGAKLIAIFMIYTVGIWCVILIPGLLLGVATGGFEQGSNDIVQAIGLAFAIIYMIAVFVILVGFQVIFPMIVVHFAAEARFLAAFEIVTILKKIFSNFLYYILALILAFITLIIIPIISMLVCCTVVGALLFPLILLFIQPIIVMNLFAQVYKD
jgi:hypothetical protein